MARLVEAQLHAFELVDDLAEVGEARAESEHVVIVVVRANRIG